MSEGHNSYNANLCEPRPTVRSAPRFYQFSVKDRYGADFDYLIAPDGYEFTGEFRPASAFDPWMTKSGFRECCLASPMPVLILRLRPKRKRLIFEEDISGKSWFDGVRYSRREEEF